MDSLEKVCIKPKDKKPPFVFYYIRATQEDGHMAWSSPIWVDYIPVKLQRSVKKTTSKPQPKAVIVEEEESFDEDDYDEE
jgi:hypothetical protein